MRRIPSSILTATLLAVVTDLAFERLGQRLSRWRTAA